jgi:hypothetical protein
MNASVGSSSEAPVINPGPMISVSFGRSGCFATSGVNGMMGSKSLIG